MPKIGFQGVVLWNKFISLHDHQTYCQNKKWMLFSQMIFLCPQTRQARNTVTEGPACEPDESKFLAADVVNEEVFNDRDSLCSSGLV